MKKNVRVSARDGSGTRVEITAKIDTQVLTRMEVDAIADDIRDALMQVLPELRYTNFRLSKVVAL